MKYYFKSKIPGVEFLYKALIADETGLFYSMATMRTFICHKIKDIGQQVKTFQLLYAQRKNSKTETFRLDMMHYLDEAMRDISVSVNELDKGVKKLTKDGGSVGKKYVSKPIGKSPDAEEPGNIMDLLNALLALCKKLEEYRKNLNGLAADDTKIKYNKPLSEVLLPSVGQKFGAGMTWATQGHDCSYDIKSAAEQIAMVSSYILKAIEKEQAENAKMYAKHMQDIGTRYTNISDAYNYCN
ncbi:MAG: hypothetical protein FWG18_01235 [Alphaproteobacteria bacterium]|nr:hypothetical protein [Alphaproteobacteria bacterium]